MVPGNCTATVCLPIENPDCITEFGKQLSDTEGVLGFSVEDGKTLVRIGSGHYLFQASKK